MSSYSCFELGAIPLLKTYVWHVRCSRAIFTPAFFLRDRPLSMRAPLLMRKQNCSLRSPWCFFNMHRVRYPRLRRTQAGSFRDTRAGQTLYRTDPVAPNALETALVSVLTQRKRVRGRTRRFYTSLIRKKIEFVIHRITLNRNEGDPAIQLLDW